MLFLLSIIPPFTLRKAFEPPQSRGVCSAPVLSKRRGLLTYHKYRGKREREVFIVEIVMKNGITITIDDDEIVDWACNFQGTIWHIRLRDGSIWNYNSVDGSFCKS